MLQSLLQPRDNQRPKMIGAMPAVAVRHERRRAEKRAGGGRRPSQLLLQQGRTIDLEATPSPDRHRYRHELYYCGKTAALHAIVGSVLLGLVVLVVGLVQLSPGAEAAQHKYYLLAAGAGLLAAGVLSAVLRCVCLHWYTRKYLQEEEPPPAQHHQHGASSQASNNGLHSDHKADHKHATDKHATDKHGTEKPRLKTQASVGKDADLLVKQPSTTSET